MSDTYTYEWLENLLDDLGIKESPARVHGSLVGFLCAGGGNDSSTHWFGRVVDDDDLELPEENVTELDDFARTTARMLAMDDLRLTLLLPDSDDSLQNQAEALTEWCGGFLGGIGLSGFTDSKKLSADAREALKDLARIAKTDVQLDSDHDGNENALMELYEYAKVSAALIFQEIEHQQRNAKIDAAKKRAEHRTLQ
jgi:uncharacterized protein